jgi:antagonist of KipI
MADHQTTGGYAKAGVLVRADLPLAAQLRPGDDLGFEQVSPAKAVELLAWLERQVALAAGDLLTMLLVVDGKEHVITVDRGLRQEP